MAVFTSSTLDVPETSSIPKHIAIVMDGNGRWAKMRLMPRVAGHKRGVDAVKRTVQACVELLALRRRERAEHVLAREGIAFVG